MGWRLRLKISRKDGDGEMKKNDSEPVGMIRLRDLENILKSTYYLCPESAVWLNAVAIAAGLATQFSEQPKLSVSVEGQVKQLRGSNSGNGGN
jgi:hypothetical protein